MIRPHSLAETQLHARWNQVAIAALAQNVATGLAFGSFGTLVLAIERTYGASRTQSSLAMSLAIVALSITGMLIGRVIDRVNLRNLLVLGALVSATGFAAAAWAPDPHTLLLAYLLLIGPGTAMLGVLPSMTLATRCVPERQRGRALGIVNMPLLVMIVPLAIAPLLESYGPRTVFNLLALIDLALIPVLLGVQGGAANHTPARIGASPPPATAATTILRQPAFWVLAVAMGLVTGAGTMKLAHFVPLLVGQGHTFTQANMLLALSGGAGLIGSLLFGYLADRIGGPRALALNAAVQAVVWTIFLAPVSLGVLTLDAIVVGACGGGVQGAFGVTVASRFGQQAFGRAFSLFQIATLPFLFGMTPLASLLFERSGGYHLPMGLTVGALAFASILLFAVSRRPPVTAGD